MRIFLHTIQSERPLFMSTKVVLEKMGHVVCARTPLDFDHKTTHLVTNLVEIIEHVDLVIVSSQDIGPEELATMSLALSRQVPVLSLHQRGTLIPETLARLLQDQGIRKRFRLLAFDWHKLEEQLSKSLQNWSAVNGGGRQALGYAKFTLRLPLGMVRRLSERAKAMHVSKAIVIRQLMEKVFTTNPENPSFN